ncbi:MAG: hypothetical protein ACUVXG_14145, partial [Anaerolineae bacterium]
GYYELHLGSAWGEFFMDASKAGYQTSEAYVYKEEDVELEKDWYLNPLPNNPPYTPSNPSPASGSSGQPTSLTLTWTGGDPDSWDTVIYHLYFGTSSPPPYDSDSSTTSIQKSGLSLGTTYYWKIVAEDSHGAQTIGPVWSFMTNRPPYTPLPTDSNISAYVVNEYSTFPRADGPGQISLVDPAAFCLDSKGRLFIADSGRREVIVVNRKGQVEAIIGNSTSADVRIPGMGIPRDVTIDAQDRVYICDFWYSTIHMVGPDLTHLGNISINWETLGRPWCVAVDLQGRLLVGCDTTMGDSRVAVFLVNQFHPSWSILQTTFNLTPPGERLSGWPLDIVVDSEGRILVGERPNFAVRNHARVLVFDRDYRWLCTRGSSGDGPGQFARVDSVAVGPFDTVVVCDGATNWVSFFLQDGSYAGRIVGTEAETIRSVLVTGTGILLVGGPGYGIREIGLDWRALRPLQIGEASMPIAAILLAVLLSWGARILAGPAR